MSSGGGRIGRSRPVNVGSFMPPKPTYEIDGSRFATLEGFYDEVSRVLIPGADWGRNLDDRPFGTLAGVRGRHCHPEGA
jgi:hypothetical protein